MLFAYYSLLKALVAFYFEQISLKTYSHHFNLYPNVEFANISNEDISHNAQQSVLRCEIQRCTMAGYGSYFHSFLYTLTSKLMTSHLLCLVRL